MITSITLAVSLALSSQLPPKPAQANAARQAELKARHQRELAAMVQKKKDHEAARARRRRAAREAHQQAWRRQQEFLERMAPLIAEQQYRAEVLLLERQRLTIAAQDAESRARIASALEQDSSWGSYGWGSSGAPVVVVGRSGGGGPCQVPGGGRHRSGGSSHGGHHGVAHHPGGRPH